MRSALAPVVYCLLSVQVFLPVARAESSGQRGYSLQATDIVGCTTQGPAKPYRSPDGTKELVVGPAAGGDPKIEVVLGGARLPVPYSSWPCPEALWSPGSSVFFLNYSSGGALGSFEVRAFYPSKEGVRVVDPTGAVRQDFLAHYPKCFSPETPNVAGVAWLSESRLLVAAQVLPHSNCDAMGTFATYEVEVPSGRVLSKHGQLDSKRLFGRLLGPELQNANDECFKSSDACRIPALHNVGTVPYNKGLHQTGRGGVAFAFRWRPVVEARPAGEAQCPTDPTERPINLAII